MLVRDYMSTPPILAAPDTPISDALKTMRDRGIRRLPVVDRSGHLVGIVSDRDLLHAEPSPATSLSIWEITYLLSKVTVAEVMTREVSTVHPDTPVEVAARILCERKIGGLPVVEDGTVTGVITETDIFRVLTMLLGEDEPGIGVTATAVDRPGLLADVTRAIADAGGDVRAIASYGPDARCGDAGRTPGDAGAPAADGRRRTSIFVKVWGVSADALVAAISGSVEQIDEVR